MSKVKLTLAFTIGVLFSSCENKTEDIDFSIVPVKEANGEYQYIDLSQNGKIVINPQFSEAHIFRGGLARVKTGGKDGKWGYIDKKGKFVINPIYSFAQDFSDGVAWVQIETQPPMLIDKKGKMLLQIDSLVNAFSFNNGIAKISIYSKGQTLWKFINKNGEQAVVVEEYQITDFINNDRYAFQNKETGKWGYKNQKGEVVINEQFDEVDMFFDGMAVVVVGDKEGAIDKQGNFIINPQYDGLIYDSDGLFGVGIEEKYGWINKKGETIINPQFDDSYFFYGNKLAPIKIGNKWGYIDRKGQIAINPQFDLALPFGEGYAMVRNSAKKLGFIDKNGNFIVQPLYDGGSKDEEKWDSAVSQNSDNFQSLDYGDFLDYNILKEKKHKAAQQKIGINPTDPESIRKHYAKMEPPVQISNDQFVTYALKGDTVNMRLSLVRSRDYLNTPNSKGNTALSTAVNKNNTAVVRFLLRHGADVNIKSSQLGLTPLEDAATREDSEENGIFRMLIEAQKKKDPELHNVGIALHLAARFGALKNVQLLVENGANPNARSNEGFTPLHEAAKEGRKPVVEYLISKNVEVNHLDRDGYTPMDWAEAMGTGSPFPEVAKVLQKAGGKHTAAWHAAM